MANFIFGFQSNFVDYTPTASSEHATLTDAYLKVYKRPRLEWRSTVTTAVNIVCDFGTNKTIVGVVLDFCNWTTGDIQGHATDSWGAPTYNQPITIAQNPDNKRYCLYHVATGFTNLRYARIVIDAQTPTDSAAYFKIGRLIFLSSVTQISQNPGYGFQWTAEDFISENVTESGSIERVGLGSDIRLSGSFSWPAISSSHASEIKTIAAAPRRNLVVVFENYSGNGSDMHVCYRNDPLKLSWESYGILGVDGFDFTESI